MTNNSGQNPIQMLMQFMNGGGTPQQVMQMLIQRNPNIQQTMTQFKNMSNGKSPREMVMQLAKQKGIDINQIEELARKLGAK